MEDRERALEKALESLKKRLGEPPRHPPEYYRIYSLRATHSSRVRAMRMWLSAMETGLQKAIHDIELESEDDEDEYGGDWTLGYSYERDYYEYEVPILFYQWFLVSCYGRFEYALVETCEGFSRTYKTPFCPDEMRGSQINKCRTYLKKHLSLPFPDDTQVWADLKTIGRLRHCIVHRQGNMQGYRWENQIRALVTRIAADIPATHDRLAMDGLVGQSKPDVLVWKKLCQETLRVWTEFIRNLAGCLSNHFDLSV